MPLEKKAVIVLFCFAVPVWLAGLYVVVAKFW